MLNPGHPWILLNVAHVRDVEQLIPCRADEVSDMPVDVFRVDLLGPNPVGRVIGRIFLIERLAVDAVGKPLEYERASRFRNGASRLPMTWPASLFSIRITAIRDPGAAWAGRTGAACRVRGDADAQADNPKTAQAARINEALRVLSGSLKACVIFMREFRIDREPERPIRLILRPRKLHREFHALA